MARLRIAGEMFVVMVLSAYTVGAEEIGEEVSESPITALPSIEDEVESESPITARPSISFISEESTTAGGQATVSPMIPEDDATTTIIPSTSPSTFALVRSPSSNEAVDILEIVRTDDDAAPRIPFESMTDKLSWDVTKWKNPLVQLSNMITNENIAVAANDVRLDVKLSDPANATKVSFAKTHEWRYGPTLVLHDSALLGLPNLKTLEFSNFNLSFQGSKWLPSNSVLDKLSFEKTTIVSFDISPAHGIADASWRDSVLDSFPTAVLALKPPPTTLSIEGCTFSQPLVLTTAQFETLQNIPSVTFSQNTSPEPIASSCSSIANFQTQSFCIMMLAVSSEGKTTESTSSTANLDNLPDTTPYDASKSKLATGNSVLRTMVAVACTFGGILLVAGFLWVRRRNTTASPLHQQRELSFSNRSAKFLGDAGADGDCDDSDGGLSPTLRHSAVSTRTTTTTAAADNGIVAELSLGAQAITGDVRLGANGLWRAEHRGEAVVALRVNVETLTSQKKKLELIVASCVALRHPYITELLGTSATGVGDMWLVAEFLTKGSLRSVILKKKIVLTQDIVQRMSLHIASALAHVQSVRSTTTAASTPPTLSTRSVLCDRDLNCKLDVFDFTEPYIRDHVAPMRSFGQGEIASRAPELLGNKELQLTSAGVAMAEVYALGVIFWELSQQALVYSDIINERGVTMGEIHIAHEVAANRLRPEPSSDTPHAYAQIIRACVAFDPAQRPSVTQIVDWLTTGGVV